jgi:hypothetical protein
MARLALLLAISFLTFFVSVEVIFLPSFFILKRKINSSAVCGVLIDDYREGFVVVVVVIAEKDK